MSTHEIAIIALFVLNLFLFVAARRVKDEEASLLFGGGVSITGIALVAMFCYEVANG